MSGAAPIDAGGGGKKTEGEGGGGNTPPPEPQGGAGNGGQGGSSGGAAPQLDDAAKAFIQSEMNRVAGQVREEERVKHEKARQKEKDDAAAAALVEQGKFKDLYEAEQKKVMTLEAQVGEATTLRKFINDLVDGETKDWDGDLKKGDPGKDNVEARIKWVETFRPINGRLKAGVEPPVAEHGRGAGGGGAAGGTKPSEVANAFISGRYKVPGQK